ncbi:MAG: fibronectin type III domain-containing protein, partial [Planctomycetes bacterium]|nr:fibronectin type III domain-containing protein [Planctomycetota bacterium]
QNNTLVNVAGALTSGLRMSSTSHNSVERMCEDVEFSNNIVTATTGSGVTIVRITATGLTGALIMRNNRYHDAVGAAMFTDERVPANWTLAQWQANLSTDAGSSEGAPSLDAAWHLAGGSPCIGQGFTLAFNDDYDGSTRAGAWDIGADQTGGTALPTPPGASTLGTGGGAPDVPAAPSGVTAVPYTGQYIAVSWTDNSSIEHSFRIERKIGTSSFSTLTTVAANHYASFDPNVQDGVEYTYRVVAVGPSGESAYSNEASAVMVGTPPPPPANNGGSGDSGGGCAAGGTGGVWLILLLAIIPAAGALRRHA